VQIELPTTSPKEAERRDAQAYQFVLGDDRGLRVLRQILRFCGLDDAGPVTPDEALVATGRRQVGHYIRQRCRYLDKDGWKRFEAQFLDEEHLAMVVAERDAVAAEVTAEKETPQ